jgi:drug/metabolite transporter (DMT)-like permease
VIIQAVFIAVLIKAAKKYEKWFTTPHFFHKNIITLIIIVLWLVAGISLGTWVWAGAFVLLGIIPEIEPALYFALTIFTTLGFGDMLLDEKWRLLTGIGATNGLIILGVTTAFIAEFISRMRNQQARFKSD